MIKVGNYILNQRFSLRIKHLIGLFIVLHYASGGYNGRGRRLKGGKGPI